jgi:hypothetical protein
MNSGRNSLCVSLLLVILSGLIAGQQPNASSAVVVPRLMNYSGKAVDATGALVPAAKNGGTIGATFAIYQDQYDGAPLWIETQSVTTDSKGNYTVQLGASRSEGLPLELFTSGQARWLGVRMNGGEEQPRVMLLSVPYALKAGDAATIGGLPPSAFVLAASPVGPGASGSTALAPSAAPSTSSDVTTTGGTANTLPLFTTGTNIQSSALTQTGTGASAKIGIGVTAPAATLDVKGSTLVRGNLGLAATGNATAAAGKNSQPQTFSASSYSSGTSAPVNQNLRWQAEPAGNDTASPSVTLNFLYGSGSSTPAETGLKIASNGQITFAPGQTFPGGSGTVTSVGLSAPNTDFTTSGSPVTSSGTLALKWNVTPTSADTANALVKRDASGNFAANLITAGNVQVTASGEGIGSVSTGNFSNTAAISGRSEATGDGTTHGLNGFSSTNQGSGVYGESTVSGHGVLGVASGASGQGVWGESFGTSFDSNGQGADGVHGQSHTSAGSGVAGLNDDPNGVGVFAQGTGYYSAGSGYGVYGVGNTGVYGASANGNGVFGTSSGGFGFSTDSNVQQARTAGGWVKAMLWINGGNATIPRCFNSTLTGAAATTPPCGFAMDKTGVGDYIVVFNFEVDDRYFSINQAGVPQFIAAVCTSAESGNICNHAVSPVQAEVTVWDSGFSVYADSSVCVIVY